jgi:hypothetical protein
MAKRNLWRGYETDNGKIDLTAGGLDPVVDCVNQTAATRILGPYASAFARQQ